MKGLIQPLRKEQLGKIKEIINSTELFPSELIDTMTADYFQENTNQEIWLTYNNPEPLGILYCAPERMTDGTYNALLLAIDKKHQGKGIGGALMHHLEQQLISDGHRLLLVETSGQADFEQTRQFYLKSGYEIVARIPEYYEAGDDKIVFFKILSK